MFAQRSGNWHRDWDRHSDHWWNGHRCCFINGSWVIFNVGFYPWWPWDYPDDYYYSNGIPYNGYSDESQSNYSTVVAAQERLARQGYYHGETDGVLSPEMQKAVKRYQSTNGLRPTGYLDTQTLAVMGLRKSASY